MINNKELEIGTKIEMEHTNSRVVAMKIAIDHLREFPNYYTKGLLKMEKRLQDSKSAKEAQAYWGISNEISWN